MMHRRSVGLLGIGLLIPFLNGPAQIVGIELADSKTEAKFAPWTLKFRGKTMVVGEIISGIVIEIDGKIVREASKKPIVLVVPDFSKPELALYESGPGGAAKAKVVDSRKCSIQDSERKTQNFCTVLFPHQTLAGLRMEYLRKRAEIEQAREAQKSQKPASPEWFLAQRRILNDVDALAGWLRGTVFPAAADKLAKDYAAEVKKVGEQATKSRLESAKAALKSTVLPESLAAKTAEFGITDPKFHGRETQHFRIIATSVLTDAELDAALILGERILEAFRTDFIDPEYGAVGVETKDPIPERVFLEFFLAPEEEATGTRYLEEYYGEPIGEPREKRIRIPGHRKRHVHGVAYLDFWRYRVTQDLDGLVAHALGHALANLVFNKGAEVNEPDWLGEGFAYWIAFEHLSRNTVNCHAFDLPKYGRSELKEGQKPSGEGQRETFNELALSSGPDLGRLLILTLVEMEAPDLAKSWSFLDFLITKHRTKLRALLTSCCQASDPRGRTTLEKFRKKSQEILGVDPAHDVFTVLEDEWRRHAATDQKSPPKK